MRHRYVRLSALLTAAALLAAACGDDGGTDSAESAATTAGASGDGGASTPDASAAGSSVDDCGIDATLIEAAQDEGQVIYFAPTADDILQQTADRFQDAYGIEVSANRQPTGDLIQQVDTALEAGSVPADVVSLAEPSGFITWTANGVVRQFDIPNADDIIEGLHDPARHSYPTTFLVFGAMYNEANTDEADVPTTWAGFPDDLGDRVVAFGNPASSGSALAAWWGVESMLGADYLQGFADAETIVTDSSLTLNQLVLTGEADFAVPGIESEVIRAAGTGEPLAMIYPTDGVPVVTAEIGVLADSPNPNAGLLFAQWMMCPASQDVIHENGYRPSLEDSPIPEGVPALDELKLVPVDVPDLVERRQELVDAFSAALG